MKNGGIQLAIRYAIKPSTDNHAVKLLEDDVIPVCSPQLRSPTGRNVQLEDLAEMTMLMDEMDDHKWSQ
jgi:hypothetical protein